MLGFLGDAAWTVVRVAAPASDRKSRRLKGIVQMYQAGGPNQAGASVTAVAIMVVSHGSTMTTTGNSCLNIPILLSDYR